MNTSVLKKAGLTESQAKGYLALVEHGQLTPAELALMINESRTNTYAVADKLLSLDLVTKGSNNKTTYRATSPVNLKRLLVEQQKKIKTVDNELSGILPDLLSTYKLTNDQPGVLYLEGVTSLKKIYDDLIRSNEPLHIFPSAFDRDDPEVAAMIDAQIKRQSDAGINTRMIIRPELATQFNRSPLLDIRTAPIGVLDTQIMIFGQNVVTTTFNQGVVSTVITSPLVAGSFLQVFQALWALGSVIDTKNGSQSD